MILSQCLPWLLLPPFLAATAVHVPLNHHIRRDAEVQTDTMNFGGVWVPAPQWSVYSGLIDNSEMTTLSEVQFYGCSDSQKIQLRNAHTAAVQTAGQLYNLLNAYDPTDSMNVTTIAMLNYFFRGQLKDNPASIDYVRNVFKVISRGVSIHPNQPLTFSPIRFICVQPDVTYGWTALGLRDAAAIPVNQFFWWFVSPNDRAPCKWSVVKGLFMSPLDCQSVFIMHEMAHLAGVQLYPEAYFVKDLLAMKPLDSVHNAQTYAFAGLGELAPLALVSRWNL